MAVARDDDLETSSDELLQWSVVPAQDSVVVSLAGEVDLSTAGALSSLLQGIVADEPRFVTVDVGGVSFLDSSGIKCLVEVAACGAANGCRVVVRNPTSAIRQVFAICGVGDLLLEG